MGVVFGLLAALLWGGGDYLINRLTNLIGTSKALVVTQILSLLCWSGVALAVGFPANATMSLWGTAALCGVFHVVGLVLTYRAFEIGTLSIVSPIASSFAIVTAVLALISGERPGASALIGATLLIVGVAVVTRGSGSGEATSLKGVPEALGSALGFGVMFWMIERVTKEVEMAWPLVILKIMATTYAIAVALAKKKATEEPAPKPRFVETLALGLGIAVSDTLAWACFIWGTSTKFTTVVTALASLFSVVTIILAAVLLRERLNRPQAIGIGVVLAGVLLVSL